LALSRTGVVQPGGGTRVVTDPCVPQPQVLSFTATPTTVTFGESITLSWSVQVPAGCNYVVALLGQSVPPQGSLQVQPVSDTTYALTLAWGPFQTLYTTAGVAVG
jgi:hypothetical protein